MSSSIGEIRPGVVFLLDNAIYEVTDSTHIKQANRRASAMAKARNMRTGKTLDITLRDSDSFEIIDIEKRKLQYSYHDGDFYHFIDMDSYEGLMLNRAQIEDQRLWLKDNLELTGLFYNEELISLELPLSLNLKVVETEPGYRGDTVKTGNKPAKLETGITVQVPLFINSGDVVKVDTRNKEYQGRV